MQVGNLKLSSLHGLHNYVINGITNLVFANIWADVFVCLFKTHNLKIMYALQEIQKFKPRIRFHVCNIIEYACTRPNLFLGSPFTSVLDVQAFERLLGPCMDILKRNISDYEEQLVHVFGSKAEISDLR